MSDASLPRCDYCECSHIMIDRCAWRDMHMEFIADKTKICACALCESLKPKLREYTSAERKEIPLHTIMSQYFPDALAALARHSKKNNDKHNPGEPLHWSRNKSSDHLECAARHLLTPNAIDPVSGETELVAAFWRLGAAVQLQEEKRLVAAGIRPLSGIVP